MKEIINELDSLRKELNSLNLNDDESHWVGTYGVYVTKLVNNSFTRINKLIEDAEVNDESR